MDNFPISLRPLLIQGPVRVDEIHHLTRNIRKTCPCDVYPLEPHFYIDKLGYARVCRGIPIFLIFAPKRRLWVLVRTASARWF